MDQLIALVNAMSAPFVAFTFVVIGAPAALLIIILGFRAGARKQQLDFEQQMVAGKAQHEENLLKLRDVKVIESKPRRSTD